MLQAKSNHGPTHQRVGEFGFKVAKFFFRKTLPVLGGYGPKSAFARDRGESLGRKLTRGEPVYLVGIHSGGHGAGVALVEVTKDKGVNLIANNEEERFQGIKYYPYFPERSIEMLIDQVNDLGLDNDDIHAILSSFDYGSFFASILRTFLEEIPKSLTLLRKEAMADTTPGAIQASMNMAFMLGKQLGFDKKYPIIGMNHHGNHAYFSYSVSPFASSGKPTLITVIDGNGDDSSISIYLAKGSLIQRIYTNFSFTDSLGSFYRFLSSTQGGWTPLSSEGRYMGAVAWGDQNRLTNPYYEKLRQLLHFEDDGQIYLNRSLANWHLQRWLKPYSKELEDIIGPPILFDDLWNPDEVLRIDIAENDSVNQERVDKAAAVQMIFEDGLIHIVDYFIRTTRCTQLVLTGGTALNCLANSRLLGHFNEEYYQRNFSLEDTCLHIWIPPVPGDQGTVVGSAYQFAIQNGASPGDRLQHAFYCGKSPTTQEITSALNANQDIGFLKFRNLNNDGILNYIADLLAFIVSQNGIIGIFQGKAETGPRALGHRSILANPCNPNTLESLNKRVKFREVFRPLAPMATYNSAKKWFNLFDGASDDEHNAYNYMVLTANAKAESWRVIPAVIHKDGSSRVQIVRKETDPFTHAFLRAMGRRLGVEVSVNTSLNVGSPIVQSSEQALDTLRRAKNLSGVLLISQNGEPFLAWHNIRDKYKDGGNQLLNWIRQWEKETNCSIVEL